MKERPLINDLTIDEIRQLIEEDGHPKFRATQVFKWIHQKGIIIPEDMKNLPREFQDYLKNRFNFVEADIVEKLISQRDNTKKYLIAFKDGNIIESVAMEYKHGITACISSQVGCRMGCSFCASTVDGLVRNLTPGEIEAQILTMQKDNSQRISNVVIMGSGEPLDNFDNIVKFLHLVNDKDGLNIGYRHITISTCGLVPNIYALSDLGLPITLAISLHAPNDELRSEVMPIAKRYSIDEILTACDYYISKTNRRVTIEYALIAGVNDSSSHAQQLAQLLRGKLFHVNLIPVNNVSETKYKKPSSQSIDIFKDLLIKKGIQATQRREMGTDINAACGQLRKSFIVSQGENSN